MPVIQFFLAMIHMVLIPYLTGVALLPAKGRQEDRRIWTLAAGIMVCYGVYECIALIFIRMGWSFRLLTALYAVAACFLAFLGAVRVTLGRKKAACESAAPISHVDEKKGGKPDFWFLVGIGFILVQIGAILLWATPDKDDAFYSGLSSLCLMQNRVFGADAYSGFLTQGVSRRYLYSALPAYQASLTLLTSGMHHLIITHNLFPLFYMPLAYALLYSIGKTLLGDGHGAEKEGKGKLLFAIGLLHMIGNYFVFSPENFLVTRIWQGKALFVTLGIPCIWHFACSAIDGMLAEDGNHKKSMRPACWLLLAVTLLAVTFMGETGLYLGPFMLFCICISYAITRRSIKQFLPAALCCIPEGILLILVLI